MHPLLLFLLPLTTTFLLLFHTILWIPRRTQLHFRRQGITGPPYRPFIGNASDIRELAAAAMSRPMPELSHDILWRVDPRYALWSAAHGKTFLFWFGTRPRLAFAEPEMVKEVLLNTSSGAGVFERMQETPLVKCLLGDGLFRLRGQKWAKHRRIISPAFNMERVKEWVPVMVASTLRMIGKWDKENEGKATFEIEVHKELHNFTADVISRVAFGSSYDEGKRIFQLQEEQMINVSHAIQQVYIPGFRFLPTESNKRMWSIDKEIEALLKKLVQSNQDTDKNSRYLLNLMICAKKHQKQEERIETQEIIEECKAFYFAGKETGANFLTWVLILLASYPDWQQKVREEVIKICGQQHVPEAEDLGKLNLVNMILCETLRLYPPVVSLTRQTCKNVKLGALNIPAGTQLYIPILAIHHDVNIWGEDANEFNPLRFSDTKRHMAAFVPFGLGARICIGQNLVMMEAKLALAIILQHYIFKISSSYVHAPMLLLTLQPQHGAYIQFQRLTNTRLHDA
ncbi:hypothetical protein M5K25_025620 [Dendrobium thyrsiflorum]|uniref:Cytochrome P450 n=1 Tax=Dendrobium thyrsiflorum TaxID=117978 RepID=A0ABD0UA61_DENTH